MPDAPVLDRPPGGPCAYVTLVTNADYLPGVRALVRSLTLTGTGADVVVMHTPHVAAAELALLAARGANRPPARRRTGISPDRAPRAPPG